MNIDHELMVDGINPDDPWTPMTSGLRYYYLRPKPDMFTVDDAVIAMGRIQRWGGHGHSEPLNLNQHHLLVEECLARTMPVHLPVSQRYAHRVSALTHDVHEIFVGDVARPLKKAMRNFGQSPSPYDYIESLAADCVYEKFGGVMPGISPWARAADNYALAVESMRLWGECLGLELPPEWETIEIHEPEHAAKEMRVHLSRFEWDTTREGLIHGQVTT